MNNHREKLNTSVNGLRQMFEQKRPGYVNDDNHGDSNGRDLGYLEIEDIKKENFDGRFRGSSGSGMSLPKWEERYVFKEAIKDARIWGMEQENVDPLELSEMSFQDINLVDIIVNANPRNVWDFCVGYAAIAMGRKGDPTELINIGSTISPINVGLYHFAALAIFYNIYQCSIGQIPILQMVSKEFKDLMNAASACNRGGNAYTVDWPDSPEEMIRALPYNSYTNQLITLAPATGAYDSVGRPILNTTIPSISLDQVIRVGPRAFETIQRYFLFDNGDWEQRLVPYTTEGRYYTNVSMFAQPVQNNSIPINGVYQVINEVKIPARDTWLASLSWYSGSRTLRTAWNAKTIQQGSHLCLYKLLKGQTGKVDNCTQSLHHMVNVSCGVYSTLASVIAAELNTDDAESLTTIDMAASTGTIELPNLGAITPGEFLTWYVSSFVRRFWLGAALCAGTPMPDVSSRVFGAGSRYCTFSAVDNSLAPRCMTESLADLSSFISPDGNMLNIPVPTIRGQTLSCSLQSNTTSDMSEVVKRTFPTTTQYSFDASMAVPTGTDLPSVLSFAYTDAYGISYGPAAVDSMNKVSSMLDILQSNLEITTANASRDGVKSSFLNMTHYLEAPSQPSGYDLSPISGVRAVLNTVPVDPRAFDTVFTSFAPVMFGALDKIPAYQVIYKKQHRTQVDRVDYALWRQGYLIQFGHKRSSQPWSGSGSDLHYYHDSYMEKGGNIITKLFSSGGIVHNGAKLLAQGILNFLDNKENKKGLGAKISGSVKGKSEDEILAMVREGKLNPGHLSPVQHGWISESDYSKAVEKMLQSNKSNSVVQRKTNVRTSKRKR